jgi:TRAP-type C4-dicarboxylate transport system permease small subunit
MFKQVKASSNKPFLEICWLALRKGIDKIEKVMIFFAVVFLVIMMVGIVLDAAMRYIFNKPLSIAYELNEIYLLPAIIFFTISYTMKKKGHIGVTLFHRFFSKNVRMLVNKAGYLIGAILFAIITWQGIKLTSFAWYNSFVTTGIFNWPLYLGYAFVPLGSFVMALRCFLESMNGLYGGVEESE